MVEMPNLDNASCVHLSFSMGEMVFRTMNGT